MRASLVAALFSGFVCATSASEGVIDLSKKTCRQFLESNDHEMNIIIAWLDGYYNEKNDPLIIDYSEFDVEINSLTKYCAANPTDSLMTAAEKLIGPSPAQTDSVTKVTNIGELPPLPEPATGPDGWDLIEGLGADVVQGSAVAPGQRILRLVAVGADSQSDGRHALGARFSGLAPGGIYRATAWLKAEPSVRVMIEARDSIDPNTGGPSNYGIARFDLGARSVVDSTGDIIASGVEAAADDWAKLWVDLRSKDGEAFVTIGLLEGSNNRHVFKPAGQEVTFGGFEASHRQ